MNMQPTPSELIYLYMDGELEAGQHQELFSLLSTSPELQEEFNDAMAMKSAFESERLSTTVPPSITESVMTNAGVEPLVSSGVSSSLITGLGTTVMTFLRKSVLPMSLLVAGAGVMYLAMTMTDNNSYPSNASLNQSEVKPDNNNSRPTFASDGLQESSPTSSKKNSDGIAGNQRETSNESSHSTLTANSERGKSKHNNLSGKDIEFTDNGIGETSNQKANSNLTELGSNTAKDPSEYTPYKEEPVEPAIIEQPTLSYARAMPLQQGSRRYYSQPVALSFNPLIIQTTSFRLQLNRLVSISPTDNSSSVLGVADNLSLTGLYYWNNNNAIGVDVGRFRFPVEAVIDNEVQINPIVTAVSAVYSYRDSGTEIFGGEPFIQCQVGYSTLGIPVLVQGGLGYTLGPVRLNAGVETGSLLYKARDGGTFQPSSPLFRIVGGVSFGL